MTTAVVRCRSCKAEAVGTLPLTLTHAPDCPVAAMLNDPAPTVEALRRYVGSYEVARLADGPG